MVTVGYPVWVPPARHVHLQAGLILEFAQDEDEPLADRQERHIAASREAEQVRRRGLSPKKSPSTTAVSSRSPAHQPAKRQRERSPKAAVQAHSEGESARDTGEEERERNPATLGERGAENRSLAPDCDDLTHDHIQHQDPPALTSLQLEAASSFLNDGANLAHSDEPVVVGELEEVSLRAPGGRGGAGVHSERSNEAAVDGALD